MKVLIGVLMLANGLVGWSQTAASTRYPIEPGQAAAALSNEAMHIEAGQVKMLAQVTASEANPQLDILNVTSASGRTGLLVTLGCRKRNECLPFYVLVEGNAAASELLTNAERVLLVRPVKKPQIMMRAGTHATLRMDSPRAQISMTVISLESGGLGSRIRVATPDHKEVYVGEVVGPNLLKGSF